MGSRLCLSVHCLCLCVSLSLSSSLYHVVFFCCYRNLTEFQNKILCISLVYFQTHRYLQNLSMWNFLGFEQQTYTFFAPINGAYQNIPGSIHDDLLSISSSDSAKQTVNEMFLNHGGMLTITFEIWHCSKRSYTHMMHWKAWRCFHMFKYST